MRAETFFDQQNSFPDIDGIWNFDDFSFTEQTIRGRLPPFTEKNWPAPAIELLTQLARVEALQGKLLEAAGLLTFAKELITRISREQRSRVEIRYLLEQGRVYCLAKTPIQAQECFRKAWSLALEQNLTFFAIDAALMQALCQPRKFQREWLTQAQKLAQDSNDPNCKLWLSSLFLLVGWDFFDVRKFSEAHSEFQKALEIKKAHDIEWALGRTLRAMNRLEEALSVQTALMGEFIVLGKINGYVYLEIAECFQLLKKPDDARRYFELAFKALKDDKWFADNKESELDRIEHLSKFK